MAHADQLILGNIFNFDTDRAFSEAIAVRNGKVVYIGSEKVARRFCGSDTQVLDYGRNTVYPGFIEAHCHGLQASQRLVFDIDLTPGGSMEEYAAIAGEFIRKNPGKKYYKGSGWAKYAEPTAEMLDRICADAPVVLQSVDGHSMWLNSCALKAAGVTAQRAKEYGYDLVHVDERGEPTGLICEKATEMGNAIACPTKDMIKEGLLAWQEFAFAHGLTAACEAMSDCYPDGEEAYAELVREGKWKLRTYAYPTLNNIPNEAAADELKRRAGLYNSEYFRITGLKCFVDGVVEAHTASLIDGYADDPSYHGVNYFTGKQELLNRKVASVNAAGFPVHFHTIGDLAVRTAMDAVEYSVTENCDIRPRNALAHLQVVSPEDIRRMAEYHCTAVVAPLWVPVAYPYFNDELGNLGEERAWHEYPIRSFEDAGATIAFHTDYPVSPQLDPARQLFTAVKRMDPEQGVKSVKNPDEGISFLRALMASTVNAAYMLGADDTLGSLSVGRAANCTVYDVNFLSCTAGEAANAKLVATVVDGAEVWRAAR